MGVLRVNVGGTWVDVVGSGSDEVYIGTDDPIGVIPSTELWYDTDAVAAIDIAGSLPIFATWAALIASPAPLAVGSQAWVTAYNVTATWNGTSWFVPRGTVLNQTAAAVVVTDAVANGTVDVTFGDASTYPFATVAEFSITGFYVKPDRGSVDLWAQLYTNNYASPSGGGLLYDETAHVTSSAAAFYLLRSLHSTQPIAANASMTWVLRHSITIGGNTFFSHRYNSLLRRVAA